MTDRIAVIGGGIAGLATAALLAREGNEVTLFEARDKLGGRAASFEQDGFRFDEGPSWYLMPEVFDHFYRLLGTSAAEQLDLVLLDPGYRVFFEPQGSAPAETVTVGASRAENVAIFDALEPGAGAALRRYLDSAAEVYRLATERFLYTTFADLRPIFRGLGIRAARLLPLLLRPLHRFVASRFKDDRIRKILGYPAVFLGASPFETPSMYHLMSHLDLDDGVLYPQGGIIRVIETLAALAEAEGVTIRTGSPVTGITTKPVGGAKPTVLGVSYRDAEGTIQHHAAGTVVAACDLHFAETELLPPALQTYPESWWERRVAGPGALLIYLGVRGELPQLPHHTLLFAKDWAENFGAIFGDHPSIPEPASIYLCKPSATDAGVALEGHENLFVLVPIPADPALGHGGDAEIEALADRVLEQIEVWTGIPDLRQRIVTRRTSAPGDLADGMGIWKGSALGPAHTLRQSAFFRAGNVSRKVTGLYYAGGSTIPGIGLPMCLISAELVLKRLRGDTTPGPLPVPQQS
jgi:phytoene desaturase